MSCNIQKKTLDHFKKKGLLEAGRKVPTEKLEAFEEENQRLTLRAKSDKNVDMGPLFKVETTTKERSGKSGTEFINRVVPNTEAFDAIQKYNDNNPNIFQKEESFEQKLINDNKNKIESFAQKFVFGKSKKQDNIPLETGINNKIVHTENLNDIREKLFNGNLTNISANQFLRNALYNLDLNKETERIVKNSLSTRAKIKFVSKERLVGPNTYAQYNSNSRTIELNRDILGIGNLYYAFESILHEIEHDFTVQALLNPKNDVQRQFRQDISEEFSYFKELGDNTYYGFKNEAEFIAELMSNNMFREHLRDIERSNGVSIYQKILNALKALFGFDTNTPRVDSIIDSILNIHNKEYTNHKSLTEMNYVFQKETEKSKKNNYSNKFNKELTNVNKLIENILARIEAVKNKSRATKGYKNENQKKFKELQELMEELYEKSSNEALLTFTNFANTEIQGLLNSLDKQVEKETLTSDFLYRAGSYISIYESLHDIRTITNRQYNNGELTKEEYDDIKDSLRDAEDGFKTFNTRYVDLARDIQAERLAPFNTRPIAERKAELEREYIATGLKDRNINKDKWINDKLDEEILELRDKALEQVRRQLEFIPMDLGLGSALLVGEKNLNNLVIQLTSLAIDKGEMELRDFATDLRNEFYKQSKEYGATGTTNKYKYRSLISKTKGDSLYLTTKYSADFLEEFKSRQKRLWEINDEYGFKSKKSKEAYREFKRWKIDNIKTVINDLGLIVSQNPSDKWLNPKYKKLSVKDKSYIEFLTKKATEADELTHGYKPLVTNYLDTTFVKLPAIRNSDLDRLLSGDIKGLAQDKTGDIFKVRADDTTRGELTEKAIKEGNIIKKMVTITNEERLLVPIHFRNDMGSKDQSLDLPTIFLLNSAMAKEFDIKQKMEADSKLLLDVVAASTVTKTEYFTSEVWKSIFSRNKEELQDVVDKGINSKVHTKLKSITENRIYGITTIGGGKILGKDIASIANGIGGYSAHLALAVNYLSSIPNLMQGKIQNFIEGVGGNVFTRADLRWAEATYWKELANGGLNDIGSTVNHNKISMLIDKFDLMGDFNAIKNKFEDSSKFRAMFKSSTLHGMNSSAEHYIQSTLMLAVMKSVKMKNAKNEYIDANGKVVSKENALNLYDAFEVEDNKLVLNSKADHSSFSRSKFSDLGLLEHQNLIRKKIIDLHGLYDSKWQADARRYWWGKLMYMFRNWLIPSYYRRWRGVAHTNKKYDELTDEQKFYDPSLQEFNEGMYTSVIRFIRTGLIPSLKEFKIELAIQNWKNLTDNEKANIHKTLREILVMSLMSTAAAITIIAAKDAPDEDDERTLFLLAYLFKRQETELQQYWSITDQMRIFRTPFAAMTTVEKTIGAFNQLFPWNINEKYETGENKDRYKAWVKSKKLIPVISQSERSAEKSLNFLMSLVN